MFETLSVSGTYVPSFCTIIERLLLASGMDCIRGLESNRLPGSANAAMERGRPAARLQETPQSAPLTRTLRRSPCIVTVVNALCLEAQTKFVLLLLWCLHVGSQYCSSSLVRCGVRAIVSAAPHLRSLLVCARGSAR